ncbi:MAG: hypothetical protein IJP16_09160 [Clostridia bacterium]|nr:hypothetical protein [Clostridia bacterium]
MMNVSASKRSVKATLDYNDIKICIDGNYITPKDAGGNVVEPFIINGTTYLPVRAVASALGKEVIGTEIQEPYFLERNLKQR